MKFTKELASALAALLLIATPAVSQDEIVLQDHHILHGQVISSTADSVVFEHVVGGTSEQQTYSVDDIDPHSFYIIRTHAIGDDAAAHVELGKYCMAQGLCTRARNQFIEAGKLDPSLKAQLEPLMAEGRAGTASQLLEKANALQKSGDHAGALREATAVIRMFPDSPSADKARELVGTAHENISEQRSAQEASAAASSANEEIARVQKDLQRAADLDKKGLQSKEQDQALQSFANSITLYQKSLKDLTGLAKAPQQGKDEVQKIQDLIDQTTDTLVGVYINAGSIYMTRTDYNSALREANQALAIAPDSGTAKSFRARVASASGDSDIGVYPVRAVRGVR